eukprot:364835-Chlamydomonas_euryale.AAC.2
MQMCASAALGGPASGWASGSGCATAPRPAGIRVRGVGAEVWNMVPAAAAAVCGGVGAEVWNMVPAAAAVVCGGVGAEMWNMVPAAAAAGGRVGAGVWMLLKHPLMLVSKPQRVGM